MVDKKIAIMGVGAIGGTIGGCLSMAGYDVTLIDQWPENVDLMNSQGLRMSGTHGNHEIPVKALHLTDVSLTGSKFDIVFLATKSYDTKWAATFLAPHLKPSGVVISAQNSINDPIIAQIVGYNRVLSCILNLGSGMYAPAHVVRTNDPEGITVTLGELHCKISPRLKEIEYMMASVGNTKLTTNTWGERWAKLAVNCMVNPMSGITGISSSEVRQNESTRGLIIKAAAETVRVATKMGVTMEPINGIPAQAYLDADTGEGLEFVQSELAQAAGTRGEGLPSLLQDIKKGRRTEIDYLNGYVVVQATKFDIHTPINQALTRTVKKIESDMLAPALSNLDILESYI